MSNDHDTSLQLVLPTLPVEIIIEIANHASPSTKSKFPCLNRQFKRLYAIPARKARVRARRLITQHRNGVLGEHVNTKARFLPNMRLDGFYCEYYILPGNNADRNYAGVRRLRVRYINGNKHGLYTLHNKAGQLLLTARYDHGAPYGIWRATFYDVRNHDLPTHDPVTQKYLSYRESIWFDTKNHTLITWIKTENNVVSVKITRKVNADNLYDRLFPYRTTAYEYRLIRIKV